MARVKISHLLDKQVSRFDRGVGCKCVVADDTDPPELRLNSIITFSRQLASGGEYIAQEVAKRLNFKIYHKDLVDKIANKANLRRSQVESLDEKSRQAIEEWYKAIMMEPNFLTSSEYFKHLSETVLSIAQHGRAVIVGRGANFILGERTGLRVRVIAPEKTRIERLMKIENIDEKKATKLIRASDKERRRFIKEHFGKKVDDEHDYDLIINTEKISLNEAIDMIVNLMKNRLKE